MTQLVATVVQLTFVAVVLWRLAVTGRRQHELLWRVMALEERVEAACLPSVERAAAMNRAKRETTPDVVDVSSSKS